MRDWWSGDEAGAALSAHAETERDDERSDLFDRCDPDHAGCGCPADPYETGAA